MAAAGAVRVVVHRGNTPEKIAEYEEIYDYSRVQSHLQQEAKKWFGYDPRPPSYTTEYYMWRKWNDPRRDNQYHYEVQYGKSPILDRETGELALSPTVLEQKLYKNGKNEVQELFEKLRQAFLASVQPKVEQSVPEDKARTEEEAGADDVEDDVAKKMLKLKMS
jgi:hypothetical protein